VRSRIDRSVFALLMLALALLATHRIVAFDLWWQLAAGEWILAQGLPQLDPFSYAPGERVWIELRWLGFVVAALGERAFGLDGLIAAKVVLLLLCFACLRAALDSPRGTPLLGGTLDDHAVSGPPLKPIALHAVHALRSATDRPIVGTGGVRSAIDAIDLLVAGANAVGVATAAILGGDDIYRDLDTGLHAWMAAHDVHDFVGLAPALGAPDRAAPTGPPVLDREACDATGRCATVCPYGAITRDDEGCPSIEPLRCVRCGLCVTTCPTGALDYGD